MATIDLEAWDAWIRIARDSLIVSVGTFMLIFETVFARTPNAYLIGAGLAALDLPPALRLDLRSGDRRQKPDPPAGEDEWTSIDS